MELLKRLQCRLRTEGSAWTFFLGQGQAAACLEDMCPDGESPTEGGWTAGGREKVPSIRKTERTETACSKQNLQGVHSTQPNKNSSNSKPEERGRNNARECKLAMARTCRRKTLPPKPEMPLQNRFVALQTEEALLLTIQTSVMHLTQSPTAFSCSNWLHMAWTRIFLSGWKTGWMAGPREWWWKDLYPSGSWSLEVFPRGEC